MGVILGEAVGDAGAGPKLPQSELSTCETGLAQPTQPFHTLFCSFWLCDCQVQSAKHAITAVTDCGFAGNVAFPVQLWHLGFVFLYFYGIPNFGAEQLVRAPPRIPAIKSEEGLALEPAPTTLAANPTASEADEAANAAKVKDPYGFYLHVYGDPAAVIYQVREVKKFFPRSPIYVMSDGGLDFSALCEKEGCTFVLCPPANDRWHPWPFFRRLYDAAVSLNTKYIIMLEPDNTVHSYVKRPPPADVGGLLVTSRQFGLVKYVERMAKQRVPNFKWTSRSMSSGLCGGAYFKREAILDALSDESMMKLDWNYLGEKLSKEIFSSDFALQYAFAARGWVIEPWEDAAQMDKDKYQPLTGARDATFKHYCSCYPGGKPTYNLKLAKQDAKLFKSGGYEMTSGPYSSSVCQVCYNHSRYLELWGSARCTNSIPFHLSEKLLQRHHPEMQTKPCDLPWLCVPGAMRGRGADSWQPTAAPVDPLASYTLLDDATLTCPAETKKLDSVDQCQDAANKLNKKLAYTDELYQEADPPGCIFRVPDNDVYFNAPEEGQKNDGRRLICQNVVSDREA
ncbi:Peptidyl-prolyl cis-trans isomerase A [Durusdinium trenchii]|uniref:Peptidyl-prolyl cis-trans isomerase A n=1 Tax=Durusdinium trenchii TaxID=1381693 RepID=A0ABP0RBD4_9DINO